MICRKCKKEVPDGAFCLLCGTRQEIQRAKHRRGNGEGTVIKRGQTYTIYVTKYIDGKRVVKTKGGFATKKEAYEYASKLDFAPKTVKDDISLAALYERWKPYYEPRVGKTTMAGHEAAYKWVADLHHYPFALLVTDDWQDCVNACTRGKRTKENIKALATALYKYAISIRLCEHNYAQYIWCGNDKDGTYPAITADELEIIRKAVGKVPYADYVYALCYTGFRPTALLKLKPEDYDKEHGCLIGGIKTAAGIDRIVTVSPKIKSIIEDRISAGSKYIFPNIATGEQLTAERFRTDVFNPLMDRLGIKDKVPYSCRHTFANLLKNVSGSDTDKAALMGHTEASMTKYYQSADYESLRAITDAL